MKNINERIKMVKAMEFIARQLNDELIFDEWLAIGVGDGDIQYGDLTLEHDIDLEYYVENDAVFADLMDSFLLVMSTAYNDKSGLYCDGIVSKPEGEEEFK